MAKIPHSVEVVLKALLGACMFMFLLGSIWTAGPWIESTLFPVTTKMKIVNEVANGDGSTTIMVAFTKLRTCQYIGIGWYQKDSQEKIPVITRTSIRSAASDRPIGIEQQSGPWIIGLAPDELHDNSYAELYYRCHQFWITVSSFYP